MTGIKELDHIAVMVTDLSAAGVAYEKLGFALTPVSQHSGALRPGAAAEPWGTANRCAMFRQGYLELMGVIDDTLYDNHVPGFLERYEGIHILAFGCGNASEAANALAIAGFGATGVHALARPLDTPEGERIAQFNLVRLPPDEMPEGRVLAIEHLTRGFLWQDRYLDHPNGALALKELFVCVADVAAVARRYARYFGVPAAHTDASATFKLTTEKFVLLDARELETRFGVTPPSLPFAAAFTVAVDDLEATHHFLQQRNIVLQKDRERLFVAPIHAKGAVIVFEEMSHDD